MTKFADQLFDDLMREHGPALAHTTLPAPRARSATARRAVLTAGGGLVAAGAVAGTLVAAGGVSGAPAHNAAAGTPAYAVTKNPDGTITLDVYRQSGIAGANARLHELGDKQVVVVPVEPGCPSLGSLPKPPVSGRGHMISVGTSVGRDGSVTVQAHGIPAGDIMVVGVESIGRTRLGASALTSSPPPSCISLPAPPAGTGGSGS
jgi:hypothetical protein